MILWCQTEIAKILIDNHVYLDILNKPERSICKNIKLIIVIRKLNKSNFQVFVQTNHI